MRHIVARQRTRVDTFLDDDARVLTKLPVQLAVSHVEGDHFACASLQPHVGEPTGRCADVKRTPTLDADAELVERVGELDPAATDVRMIGCEKVDTTGTIYRGTGLRNDAPVDRHLAGENHRAGPLARSRQTLFDHEDVEAFFGLGHAKRSNLPKALTRRSLRTTESH